MKFKTAYDNDCKVGAVGFSKIQKDYGYYLDNTGKRVFGVTGESNAYALIQRDKDNTDWSILKKYLFDNDSGKDIGIFGDRSIEPKDIIEAGEFIEAMQEKFNNLPKEIKEKYGDLQGLIYGFNEEDFKIFEDTSSVSPTVDVDNKGGGEDEKK